MTKVDASVNGKWHQMLDLSPWVQLRKEFWNKELKYKWKLRLKDLNSSFISSHGWQKPDFQPLLYYLSDVRDVFNGNMLLR